MFSQKKINLVVSPKGSNLNVRKEPTTKSSILFNRTNKASTGKVASVGRSTGDYIKDGNYFWYKVLLYKPYGGQTWGWVRNDVIKFYKPKSENISKKKAQKLIDNLVQTDQEVNKQLSILEPLIILAEKQGKNVSKIKARYEKLFSNLRKRQDKIKNSRILKWKAGLKRGVKKLKEGFKAYLLATHGIRINSIGVAPVVMVAAGAVAGAGLSVAAYFAFRTEYDESKTDLKETTELKKALSLLTPQEAKKLQQDLEKQVDNAYNQGVRNQQFSGYGKILKYGLIAVASFFVINKALEFKKNVKTTK